METTDVSDNTTFKLFIHVPGLDPTPALHSKLICFTPFLFYYCSALQIIILHLTNILVINQNVGINLMF